MTPESLDMLFERYVSNRLSTQEAEILRASLREPEWQRRWRDLADMEGMLAEEFAPARSTAPSGTAQPDPDVPAHVARIRRRRLARMGRARPYGMLAGAAAVLAAVTLLSVWLRFDRPPAGGTAHKEDQKRAEAPRETGRGEEWDEDRPAPIQREHQPQPPLPPVNPEEKKPDDTHEQRPNEAEQPRKDREERPPAEEPDQPTRAAIAQIERIDGETYLTGKAGRTAAATGQPVLPGQGLETTAPGSRAVLAYPDGTRLELQEGTKIREIDERQGGKIVFVERGALTGHVTRQPEGRPMVFATPQAEACVLGTRLALHVEREATRLEVADGRVRLTRLSDKKSVDVPTGHYAVAAAGLKLAARPIPRVLFAEDFQNVPLGTLPSGFRQDRPGNWAVRAMGDNRVLEATGAGTAVEFGDPGWADYEIALRLRFDAEPSLLALVVRHDPVSGRNCQIELDRDGAHVRRSLGTGRDELTPLKSAALRPEAGKWHLMRIVCRRDGIELWANGELALSAKEKFQPRGMCKLYVRKGTVLFDDVSVRAVDAQD